MELLILIPAGFIGSFFALISAKTLQIQIISSVVFVATSTAIALVYGWIKNFTFWDSGSDAVLGNYGAVGFILSLTFSMLTIRLRRTAVRGQQRTDGNLH